MVASQNFREVSKPFKVFRFMGGSPVELILIIVCITLILNLERLFADVKRSVVDN